MRESYDLIIVGGGVIASSIAFNLLRDGYTGSIALFEKDPIYEYSSTPRSAGGIRQVFSTEVNVRMSQYGLKIYEDFEMDMAIDGEPTKIDFKHRGYLFLASEQNWPYFHRQAEFLNGLNANVQLLTPVETQTMIPELNVSDLAGSLFSPNDGYMDPYSVMRGYAKKAKQLGAEYIYKEVESIQMNEINGVSGVKLTDGEICHSSIVVNASGAWSGELSKSIGVELPVAPLRRQVFNLDLAVPFKNPLPLVVDISGAYFRHEGPKIIAGLSNDVAYGYDFHWEKSFFENEIWPILAERSPIFERLKLERGWAGLYDYNYVDHNGIIGKYEDVQGYYVATGFSGHGLQHAPAAGKAISELIRLGHYETNDVTSLCPERFRTNRLIVEREIV